MNPSGRFAYQNIDSWKRQVNVEVNNHLNSRSASHPRDLARTPDSVSSSTDDILSNGNAKQDEPSDRKGRLASLSDARRQRKEASNSKDEKMNEKRSITAEDSCRIRLRNNICQQLLECIDNEKREIAKINSAVERYGASLRMRQ
jgi:hypothetical protein